MHIELSIALNFLMSYLYNKLPRRRVDVFAEELEKGLLAKFQDHWYPEDSFKGSGFRSIRIIEGKIDPVFKMASQSSGLTLDEILEQLPKGLTIWIDPDEVSYRIGETGQVTILYYNNKRNLKNSTSAAADSLTASNLLSQASCGASLHDNMKNGNQFNNLLSGFTTKPETPSVNSLSSGFNSYDQEIVMNLEKLRLESSTPFNSSFPYLQQMPASLPNVINIQKGVNVLGLPKSSINQTCFTAAAFAQTKFGSTKMKTHSNHQTRPTRLFSTSPTDLHTRLNLAAQLNALSARSPGSFIPLGLHSQFIGPWSSVNQTSAPSSCLGSPCNELMPTSTNQLFANLLNQPDGNDFKDQRTMSSHQQHLFEGLPNSLITNEKSNFSNISTTMPLLAGHELSSSSFAPQPETLTNQKQSLEKLSFKHENPFLYKSQNSFQQQPQPALKNVQPTDNQTLLTFSSSSSSTTANSSDKSPSSSEESNEWNSYVSTYPNLQHLLVAN